AHPAPDRLPVGAVPTRYSCRWRMKLPAGIQVAVEYCQCLSACVETTPHRLPRGPVPACDVMARLIISRRKGPRGDQIIVVGCEGKRGSGQEGAEGGRGGGGVRGGGGRRPPGAGN